MKIKTTSCAIAIAMMSIGAYAQTPVTLKSFLANASTANGAPSAPTYGAPTGASGLRFSDLTSSSIPQNNTSNSVLSVNSSGDVILVPDGGVVSPGSFSSQNGLNNSSPSIIELGGPLIKNTVIPLQGFEMLWNGDGQFNVSNSVTTPVNSALGPVKSTFYNTQYAATHYVKNDATSTPGITTTYGSYVENETQNGKPNWGLYSKSLSSDYAAGIQGHAKTTSPSAMATGVVGYGENSKYPRGGVFESDGTPGLCVESIGVAGTTYANASGQTYGVFGRAYAAAPQRHGVYGIVNNVVVNESGYGVLGDAAGASLANGTTYGIRGNALNAYDNYGVYGQIGAVGGTSGGNIAYAVYGGFSSQVSGSTYLVQYAGYFDGDVKATGSIASNVGILTSDNKFKTNKRTLGSTRSIIAALKPQSYNMDSLAWPEFHFSNRKQFGFIAQELEEVLPELVHNVKAAAVKDDKGNEIRPAHSYKAVNYDGLIPILVAHAQEQQNRIDSLVSALKKEGPHNRSTSDAGAGNTNLNLSNVTLSNSDALVLDQNQPNPFRESTVIHYNVPEKYNQVKLIFTTEDGRVLKTIEISKKGEGEITVYANDLSNGIYTYSLVVDGSTIDSKKMVKQN